MRKNLCAAAAFVTLVAPSTVLSFWRLPCASPITVGRLDPIVAPGQLSAHVHTVMGGSNFGLNATYSDLISSNCSTCKVVQDNSAYWVPQLYVFDPESKTFDSVNQVGGATVYYLQRNTNSSVKLHAFPPGFRMIAGSPGLKTFSDTLEQRAISYACIDYNHPSPETHSLPTTNCPQGLRSQVFFPSCWDGVNLDSTDHKSHVSYLSNVDSGVCPPTHPVQLISIFYEVMWDIDSIKDRLGHSNSNLVWSTDDSTGYSFHGDFQNGWDVAVLQNAIDQCTNLSGLVEDCPAFQLRPGGYERQCPTKKLTPETVLGKGLASIPYSCGAIYSPGVASLCSASSMTSPPLSIPTSSLVAPKSIPPSSNVLVPDSSSVISYRNTIPSPTSKKCRRRQF